MSVQHIDWQQCDARDDRGRPCTVPDGPWGSSHEGPCDFTPVDPVECGCADCRADLREWAVACADPGDEDDGDAKRCPPFRIVGSIDEAERARLMDHLRRTGRVVLPGRVDVIHIDVRYP